MVGMESPKWVWRSREGKRIAEPILEEYPSRYTCTDFLPGDRLGLTVRGGREFGLGVYVTGVEVDSVAQILGLQEGDLLLDVNGKPFHSILHQDAVDFLLGCSTLLAVTYQRIGGVPCSPHQEEEEDYEDVEEEEEEEDEDEQCLYSVNSKGRLKSGKLEIEETLRRQHDNPEMEDEELEMIRAKAEILLEPAELHTLLHYIDEYKRRRNVSNLICALKNIFVTREKRSMFTEIREIIFSADLAIFDNLVYQKGGMFTKDELSSLQDFSSEEEEEDENSRLLNYSPPKNGVSRSFSLFSSHQAKQQQQSPLVLKNSISSSLLNLPAHKTSQPTNQIHRATKHTNQSRPGAFHPIPESNVGFYPNQPLPNQRPIYQNRGLQREEQESNSGLRRQYDNWNREEEKREEKGRSDGKRVESIRRGEEKRRGENETRINEIGMNWMGVNRTDGMGGDVLNGMRGMNDKRAGRTDGMKMTEMVRRQVISKTCNIHPRIKSTKTVKIRKVKPVLGIAIEGGLDTGQTVPRIINIQGTGAGFEAGGLRVGQIILGVDGVNMQGLKHSEAAKLISDSFSSREREFLELTVSEFSPTPAQLRRSPMLPQ